MYGLGQLCGIIGTGISIVQAQFQKRVHILLCVILVNTMNALNFALIGQTGSATLLCLVAVAQSLCAIWHERQGTVVSPWESILFAVLYLGFGFYGLLSREGFVWAVNRQNLLELLPVIGAWMLMLSVFAKNEQKTRWFLLLNAASWAVYAAAVGAAVFFTTIVSMCSTAIALWKYRKKPER